MISYNSLRIWIAIPVLTLMLGFSTVASAQERVVPVEPGVGTLNEAINSDTTSTGDRVDPDNTVYELTNGGYYALTGSIENRFPLHIRAPEGGDQAQLVPTIGDGGESSRPFRARDNLWLENLYITNRDDQGGFNTRIIRVSADSARIIIDHCHLDYDAQSGLRLDNDWNTIKITNSIVSNIGRTQGDGGFDNGRGIDTRGNNVDTLIYRNTTFYNITSRLVRDGGGFIKYADVSRNMIYNVAQHGISFGEALEVVMEDNFFINPGFLGQTDSTFGDRVIVGIDSLEPDREGVQMLTIRNNHFVLSEDVVAAYPDSVRMLPLADSLSPAYDDLMDASNVHSVGSVAFQDPPSKGGGIAAVPAAPADVVADFWVAQTSGEDGAFDNMPSMDNGDGGAIPAATTSPFYFAYAESEAAYTAATDGGPIGDRNWFGMVGVAVEGSADVPEAHRLVGNYPNPFNPSTTIMFELASNAEVSVEIFDVTGKQVMSVPESTMAAGSAEVNINAIDAVSGMYVYRVMIDSGVDTKILTGTMTLLK